ncbi:hypothetical protein N799_06340 [Lysobacter arseniciresistens ZS79]|uniref:Copper amine oxidase n=2 Tax=Novilysobacter TaxID=3382699 RepID=A0A0A0EYB8_9GAMM|nr:DUF411 domain-containing protein [Lysobacter arseniciresistens]KGM55936.1 hypothetical protein N799_06340 [Lysobacter arseniciresistens ZS79]
MTTRDTVPAVLVHALATSLTACARTPKPPAQDVAATTAALPRMVVHKSPSCVCCAKWVKHLREAGFSVDIRNEGKLEPVKTRLGVPAAQHSCHTAQVRGYFVEGHVPVEDIKRLLVEKPYARGLALAGMPMGSPGMESPSGRIEPFTVSLVGHDGSTTPFAQHGR